MSQVKKKPDACKGCGFHYQCICGEIPNLSSGVQIVLLQHPNERNRDTNTGRIVSSSLRNCRRYTWDRVEPPAPLLELLSDPRYTPWLLFPAEDSQPATSELFRQRKTTPVFIILDSTWQEARKMVRRSPWLQALSCISLSPDRLSAYNLRRNQDSGNLCTCEAATELLRTAEETENAEKLEKFFRYYLTVFKADKSGHSLGSVDLSSTSFVQSKSVLSKA